MNAIASSTTESRLHALQRGVADLHFDLLMDLYEKRVNKHHPLGVLGRDFWAQLQAGGIGFIGAAIYLEDKYVPELALRVAMDQIALLHEEVAHDQRFAICRTYAEIESAGRAHQIAILITMEGVEPLGTDIHLLRAFYEMGVRSIGLTHARRNMAGDGGVFAPSGSSRHGLSPFGREVIKQCEALHILIDLAHLNPAGVEDVLAMTHAPVVLTHTNPRTFYDVERNSSDAQMKAVAARGGVIGINSVLLSPTKAGATVDGFAEQVAYVADLTGIDHVGLGFDFFDFILRSMPTEEQEELQRNLATVHLPPDLLHHGHAANVTQQLIARGFSDADIEKVLHGNWLRVLKQVLDQ